MSCWMKAASGGNFFPNCIHWLSRKWLQIAEVGLEIACVLSWTFHLAGWSESLRSQFEKAKLQLGKKKKTELRAESCKMFAWFLEQCMVLRFLISIKILCELQQCHAALLNLTELTTMSQSDFIQQSFEVRTILSWMKGWTRFEH